MSNKSSRSQNTSANRQCDDFRLINKLPQTAKVKLQAAGVLTFAQLAAMSAHEIAAAISDSNSADSKTTAERIIREDWIGQARKLATSREASTEDKTPTTQAIAAQPLAVPGEQRTSFALELKLNQDGTVKQTRVMHVESDEQDAEQNWAGWNEMRLLNFIVHRAKIALPSNSGKLLSASGEATSENKPPNGISVAERVKQLHAKFEAAAFTPAPVITNPAEPPIEPVEVPAAFKKPSASLNKLEVFASAFGLPSSTTVSNDDYHLRLLLDPAEIKSLEAAKLAYSVTIYAKNIAHGAEAKAHVVIGEAQGVIASGDDLVFDVEGAKLSQGAYRLRAAASFSAAGKQSGKNRSLKTFVEGGLLQVY